MKRLWLRIFCVGIGLSLSLLYITSAAGTAGRLPEMVSAIALRNTAIPEPSATLAPTVTPTPNPAQPAEVYPTIEPQPTISLADDKFAKITLDRSVVDGIGRTWLSFVNINDKPATLTPGTPSPASQLETIYLAAPSGGSPIKVVELPATTGTQIYWSPNGARLAYFISTGTSAGLYVLDTRIGISLRIFNLDNLNPRGILSEPVWSPDSTRVTIALATAYDVDIYSVNADGTDFRNLTQNGAFDFWPAWSPDGQYLAFVSDRGRCQSWEPNAPGSCYRPDAPAPDGGNLYIMETVSGDVRMVSDAWVIAPPRWISPSRIAFTSGTAGNPAAGSTLWWADLRGGPAHQVTQGASDGTVAEGDSWTADNTRVVYQEIHSGTNIVVRDNAGNEIARATDLNFPRVGFSANWSPDGKRLVIGGHNGQCPYGMIVTDDSLNIISKANNPTVCDPSWSPDGRFIAFTGVTQSASGTDGRYDVFIAEASGYGARNLTGRFGGQIRLIGWVNTQGQ